MFLVFSLLVSAGTETQGPPLLSSTPLLLTDLTAGPEGAGGRLLTGLLISPVTAVVVTVTEEGPGDALRVAAPEGLV